jgi:hypothetical protein
VKIRLIRVIRVRFKPNLKNIEINNNYISQEQKKVWEDNAIRENHYQLKKIKKLKKTRQ